MTKPIPFETAKNRDPGGRFRKGSPGGPGRPKGHSGAAVRQAIISTFERLGGVEWLSRIAKTDPALFVRLLAQVVPKSDPVAIALPSVETATGVSRAMAAVLEAASAGHLTLDEAQALAGILETQRRALELGEIVDRITALENHRSEDTP